MSHEIYVFGSIIRGEVGPTSDVDVLVLPFGKKCSQFPANWSIYSPKLIEEYFRKGRLFAWHLHYEARCIFTQNKTPFLESLGPPAPYSTMACDIDDLEKLLLDAMDEIRSKTNSLVYELGIAYTAIRDIAMAASWALLDRPCFSRRAPYLLPEPCPLPSDAYDAAMLARHSSTRGIDIIIDLDRTAQELLGAPLEQWVQSLRTAQ